MHKFIAVCLVAIFINYAWAAPPETPAQRIPEQYGRYVITFGPFARSDMYLLDTQTGKTWKPVQYTDVIGEPQVWMSMDRIDSDSQFGQWLARQKFKPEPSKPGN